MKLSANKAKNEALEKYAEVQQENWELIRKIKEMEQWVILQQSPIHGLSMTESKDF